MKNKYSKLKFKYEATKWCPLQPFRSWISYRTVFSPLNCSMLQLKGNHVRAVNHHGLTRPELLNVSFKGSSISHVVDEPMALCSSTSPSLINVSLDLRPLNWLKNGLLCSFKDESVRLFTSRFPHIPLHVRSLATSNSSSAAVTEKSHPFRPHQRFPGGWLFEQITWLSEGSDCRLATCDRHRCCPRCCFGNSISDRHAHESAQDVTAVDLETLGARSPQSD